MKVDLQYLGNQIRAAKLECCLSQKELAKQAKISLKTLQEIEKGRKNPTYETLARLIERLGIYADSLFPSTSFIKDEKLEKFVGKFQVCNEKSQKILLNSLHFLAEQLLENQDKSENPD